MVKKKTRVIQGIKEYKVGKQKTRILEKKENITNEDSA